MSDWDERHPHEPRDPSEGVRIIGPDEAADAERADPRGRFRPGQRRGDFPPSEPDPRAPRSTMRFPLDPDVDPEQMPRPPVAPVEPRHPQPDLPHWAESAPEEVPNMSRRDPYEGDEAAAWGTFAGTEPRWRDDLDQGPRRPPEPGYDPRQQYAEPPPGRSVFGGGPPGGQGRSDTYEDAYRDQSYDDRGQEAGYADQSYTDTGFTPPGPAPDPRYEEGYDDSYSDDVYQEPPRQFAEPPPAHPGRPPSGGRERARVGPRMGAGAGGDRDMRTAVAVGVGLAVVALGLFKAGPVPTMLLVVAVLGLASFEYFTATQRAGFDPLMPVGVVASVAAVITAYHYGESGILLVLVFTMATCTVWYLVGAGGERPMANIGATLLGFCWVGLFGAFAGLLLNAPNGIALLLAAIVPTIGYDVGALFVGRSAGSRPLSAASPNKTIEGLVGGVVLAVVGGLIIGMLVHPFDGLADGIKIGLVAAIAAPIGDLSESLIKRDLGIKDMGTLLPGHGGILDRFDALLFVLPAIWYLSRVSDFFIL